MSTRQPLKNMHGHYWKSLRVAQRLLVTQDTEIILKLRKWRNQDLRVKCQYLADYVLPKLQWAQISQRQRVSSCLLWVKLQMCRKSYNQEPRTGKNFQDFYAVASGWFLFMQHFSIVETIIYAHNTAYTSDSVGLTAAWLSSVETSSCTVAVLVLCVLVESSSGLSNDVVDVLSVLQVAVDSHSQIFYRRLER